jgi:hypothetical protein
MSRARSAVISILLGTLATAVGIAVTLVTTGRPW